MTRFLLTAAGVIGAAAIPQQASASIVLDESIFVDAQAQGFGNAPRLLTVQAKANSTVESGCTTPTATGTAGSGCIDTATTVNAGKGVDLTGPNNVGGDEAEPFPGTSAKNSTPTLADLGWTSANDILVLFNATESDGNGVVINDVTLKFYSGTTLLAAIDGTNINFASTESGNGSAGFALVISEDEQAALNALVFGGNYSGATRVAIETTISGVSGGPESFTAFKRPLPAVPEPATWGMMLIGFGAIGAAMRRRRRTPTTTRLRLKFV